jgi:hypothetical protein
MQTEKQRERLVELLNEATFGVNTQTLADHLKKETIESVAEYLIFNGVELPVRCFECKHCEIVLDIIDEPKLFCTRVVGSIPVDFADYCSYGRLKEMRDGT